MTSTIELTDGTTTVTLSDTAKYGLLTDGWAPQVATRRTSVLGGRPYTAVAEEIRLNVYGASTAEAFANLAAIVQLLDQSERFVRGDRVDPVRIEYHPQNSTMLAAVSSLVLGFGDAAPPIVLPPSYNDFLMVFEISDVRIRFMRDGVWYGDEETLTLTYTTHPSIQENDFASAAALLSPVELAITPLPVPTVISDYDTGFVLIANDAARLGIKEAEDFGALGDYTTNADAARHPSGTGVLIYTPTGTTEQATSFSSPAGMTGGRRWGIVAALRNTSATTEFAVRVAVSGPASRNLAYTRPYIVDTSTTDPRIVLLGVAECEEDQAPFLRLHTQASAASGTLVYDYLALICLDDPTSRILCIGRVVPDGMVGTTEQSEIVVDPRALTDLSPRVRLFGLTTPTTSYALPAYWRGDAFLLSDGLTLAAMWCGRNNDGGYWTAWDGSAVIDPSIVLTRRIAYLVPQ